MQRLEDRAPGHHDSVGARDLARQAGQVVASDGGFGGPPKEAAPNPFKEGTAAERLKSLKGRLDMK